MSTAYRINEELADRVNTKLTATHQHKSELALELVINRSTMSNYLNKNYQKIAEGKLAEVEEKLTTYLESDDGYEDDRKQFPVAEVKEIKEVLKMPQKVEFLESRDAVGVIGVCNLCQRDSAIGIVPGRSGFGKTYALRKYAKLNKVAYISCDESMNQKDVLQSVEEVVGIPKSYGTIHERTKNIAAFFKANQGYLLIVDEADKLITKDSQKRIELFRNIREKAAVGIVLAGEPTLESALKSYDPRLANRSLYFYKLNGLSEAEIQKYFAGYEIDDRAMDELMNRAMNKRNGCFRLLDNTVNNIHRILKENGENRVTKKILDEASNMMML